MGKDAVSCALKISVGALVLALTGCVSLTTGEENVVAELQDFANRTTALYRVPSVRISIQSATNLNTGAVYRQGNVFVTDPGDMALQKLSPDGKLLAAWPARDKHHPIGVAALPDGTTFTTEDADDGKTARVVERSPAGKELVVWQ